MSAELERLFSSTKLIIADRWNRLSMKMIEAFASLKSWYKLKEWLLDTNLFVGLRMKDGEED
jgi:hypothetical protein